MDVMFFHQDTFNLNKILLKTVIKSTIQQFKTGQTSPYLIFWFIKRVHHCMTLLEELYLWAISSRNRNSLCSRDFSGNFSKMLHKLVSSNRQSVSNSMKIGPRTGSEFRVMGKANGSEGTGIKLNPNFWDFTAQLWSNSEIIAPKKEYIQHNCVFLVIIHRCKMEMICKIYQH